MKTKLATSVEKIDQLSKSVSIKRTHMGAVEQRLEKEKKEADDLRLQLDRETREKAALRDKLKAAENETSRMAEERQGLSREVDDLIKDNEKAKDTASKSDAALRYYAECSTLASEENFHVNF